MALENQEHEEEVRSIDDTILDTLKEIQGREDTDTLETPAVEGKPERVRDETGKFAKAESAAPETASQPSSVIEAPAPEAADPLVTTTGQPIDINRPPASWKPAAKAQWAALPEPVRSEIYRREGDFLNGHKGIKENADFGQTIKSTIEPYRMLIEAEGGTPERAIADTMRTAALFRVGTPQQKLSAIFELDQRFNAGLRDHFQQAVQAEVAKQTGQAPQQTQQPQQFQDPRVDQLLAAQQQEQRQRAAQEEAVSNAATTRFISAVDDKGQPLYPFVDNVLSDMAARVSQLRTANPSMNHEEILKQAYDAAVWANPETRAVLMSQQQATAQQPAETLRKLDQAKRASGLNITRRGALPAGEAVGTMDDTIRETYRQLAG